MSLTFVVALGLARRAVKGVGRRHVSRSKTSKKRFCGYKPHNTDQHSLSHAPSASPPPRLGTPPYIPRQAGGAGGLVRGLTGLNWQALNGPRQREQIVVVCPPAKNTRHLDAPVHDATAARSTPASSLGVVMLLVWTSSVAAWAWSVVRCSLVNLIALRQQEGRWKGGQVRPHDNTPVPTQAHHAVPAFRFRCNQHILIPTFLPPPHAHIFTGE